MKAPHTLVAALVMTLVLAIPQSDGADANEEIEALRGAMLRAGELDAAERKAQTLTDEAREPEI